MTAAASTIRDKDGLHNVTYAYQRLERDDVVSPNILGATSQIYTIRPWDQRDGVLVKVSFEDDLGNKESRTSVSIGYPGTVLIAESSTNPEPILIDGIIRLNRAVLTYHETLDTDAPPTNPYSISTTAGPA